MANFIGEGDGRHPPATADDRPQAPLRSGWTTGTCAAAAAAAAYQALLTGSFPDPVTVTLPRGGSVTLSLHRCRLEPAAATASVIKDAGDDPDVTHGAEVVVTVAAAAAGHGITFHGGAGVGIVTLPGLPVAVGEPAINPGPRQMIGNALTTIAARAGTTADLQVTIAIPGGAELAERTLNGRLGIRGGLSILGTTGIVKPFSCAAWIHSLHRGVDVARASRFQHLAATTGSVSEAAVQRLYSLPDAALIDMGDFAGGLLKYLRTHPVPWLTLAGGFAKLAKLAQGSCICIRPRRGSICRRSRTSSRLFPAAAKRQRRQREQRRRPKCWRQRMRIALRSRTPSPARRARSQAACSHPEPRSTCSCSTAQAG